jgi:hypothetical protein
MKAASGGLLPLLPQTPGLAARGQIATRRGKCSAWPHPRNMIPWVDGQLVWGGCCLPRRSGCAVISTAQVAPICLGRRAGRSAARATAGRCTRPSAPHPSCGGGDRTTDLTPSPDVGAAISSSHVRKRFRWVLVTISVTPACVFREDRVGGLTNVSGVVTHGDRASPIRCAASRRDERVRDRAIAIEQHLGIRRCRLRQFPHCRHRRHRAPTGAVAGE